MDIELCQVGSYGEKQVDMLGVQDPARYSLLVVILQYVVVQMAELKMQQRALQQLMVECQRSLDVGGEHSSATGIAGVISSLEQRAVSCTAFSL